MYEMATQVTYSRVKSNLKTDMAAITHYFQDCAICHSESVGKGLHDVEVNGKAWFLSGWQIEVLRYPEFNEAITVRTWAHGFKGINGYRNFDILDIEGEQIVRANSIWIFMDLKNLRPMKPGPEDLVGYNIESAIDMDYAPRKIQIMEDAYRKKEMEDNTAILVKKSFLDSNLHVNNGRYVEVAMDFLPQNIKKMRVDYRKAATLGDVMHPFVYEKDGCSQVVFYDKDRLPFVIIETL